MLDYRETCSCTTSCPTTDRGPRRPEAITKPQQHLARPACWCLRHNLPVIHQAPTLWPKNVELSTETCVAGGRLRLLCSSCPRLSLGCSCAHGESFSLFSCVGGVVAIPTTQTHRNVGPCQKKTCMAAVATRCPPPHIGVLRCGHGVDAVCNVVSPRANGLAIVRTTKI